VAVKLTKDESAENMRLRLVFLLQGLNRKNGFILQDSRINVVFLFSFVAITKLIVVQKWVCLV